jgi:hypothetical protein
MKIQNAHERVVEGTPEQVAALVADFDAIWPVDIARAPRYFGSRRFTTASSKRSSIESLRKCSGLVTHGI